MILSNKNLDDVSPEEGKGEGKINYLFRLDFTMKAGFQGGSGQLLLEDRGQI